MIKSEQISKSQLGRYELIIRFSSEKAAREGTDGRFLFYILYIIYKMKISKSGAAALYIPETIHTSRIPTLYCTMVLLQKSSSSIDN